MNDDQTTQEREKEGTPEWAKDLNSQLSELTKTLKEALTPKEQEVDEVKEIEIPQPQPIEPPQIEEQEQQEQETEKPKKKRNLWDFLF